LVILIVTYIKDARYEKPKVYRNLSGKSNKQTNKQKGKAVNTAWQRNLSARHFAHVCPLLGGPELGCPRHKHNSYEPRQLSQLSDGLQIRRHPFRSWHSTTTQFSLRLQVRMGSVSYWRFITRSLPGSEAAGTWNWSLSSL